MTATPPSPSPEYCVREGPEDAPVVLFILPLFEEANRMRRTVRLAMRALGASGIASLLPDFPGQNESLVPMVEADLGMWNVALKAVVAEEKRPVVTAAIRGGALIDHDLPSAAQWRLAPVKGSSLLRTMLTARLATDHEAGLSTTRQSLLEQAAQEPLQLAGNLLSSDMVQGLQAAEPAALAKLRTVTLSADVDESDTISGTALWLRAEPDEDADMAQAMANDIADWMRSCGVI